MALKCGIVGLPNVGKSTLFNCLSSAKAQAANFPFCTIEPNVGVITVPDERLTKLAEIVHPGRIVPATCEIVDIAGLVKGASKGEGLGNKFLGNIRETDAIIHVLRCFEDENITHVDGSIDPIRDKEIIEIDACRIIRTYLHLRVIDDDMLQRRAERENAVCLVVLVLLTNKKDAHLGIVHHELDLLFRRGGIEWYRDGTNTPCTEVALNILH